MIEMHISIIGLAIITLFSLLFPGCRRNAEDSNSAEFVTIEVELGTSNDVHLSEFATSIEYIRLETTPECLVGSIGKLIVFRDRIIIWNGKGKTATFFCFDMAGRFIYKIRNIGKGPGEYIGVQDMFFDEAKELIVVYDASQAKLLKYSLSGEFVEETKKILLPMAVESSDSETYWFYTMGFVNPPGSESQYNLMHVDQDGNTILSSHFPYIENLDRLFRQSFYKDNGYLLFSYSYCDTIYNINGSQINPFVFIDFDKSQQLKELSRLDVKKSSERNKIIQGKDFAGLQYIKASKKYFFANYANSSFLYKLFYSFQTRKLYHVRRLVNDIDGVPLYFFPKKMTDDSMLLTINPIRIIEHFDKDTNADRVEIPDALKGINIDDNPIIAVVKLKDF